jgi:hypothetical protein
MAHRSENVDTIRFKGPIALEGNGWRAPLSEECTSTMELFFDKADANRGYIKWWVEDLNMYSDVGPSLRGRWPHRQAYACRLRWRG